MHVRYHGEKKNKDLGFMVQGCFCFRSPPLVVFFRSFSETMLEPGVIGHGNSNLVMEIV